jgi:hypothetical protein
MNFGKHMKRESFKALFLYVILKQRKSMFNQIFYLLAYIVKQLQLIPFYYLERRFI